jgi:hypothetical protein
MSAQGGTLQRRGTIELPIWPVVAVMVAAIVAAVGMSLLGDAARTRFVTSVTDSERLANSSSAIREQGAVAPAIPSIRPIDASVLERSTAAVREQGASLPVAVGISHVTPRPATVGYVGLENPGAYVTEAPAYAGFENPGAYITGAPAFAGFENPAAYATATWNSVGGLNEALHRRFSPPQEDAAPRTEPIIVNGHACMQCR